MLAEQPRHEVWERKLFDTPVTKDIMDNYRS